VANSVTARRIRIALVGLFALAATLAVPISASATPTQTDTVASVTAKLHAIAQQNEQLSEQTNLVVADVAAKQRALTAAQVSAATAQSAYSAARKILKATITAQYEGSSFSNTGALLTSTSDQNYLQQISAMNMLSVHRADVLSQVTAAKTAADTAQKTADGLLAQATATQATLKKQQASLNQDLQKYQALLNSLTAAQQAAYKSADTVPATTVATLVVHAGSAAAQAAVDFALAQVGKPYVYGAGGPGSYDCSGLTSAAWRAGGVSLPHNAAAQYGYGTHVDASQLQPGDLVFFYHPIGHVAIYIGNGLMVTAPEPGENVKVAPVSGMSSGYVGATRLT
jgi:cell wall-associated NlpC family hydrolase